MVNFSQVTQMVGALISAVVLISIGQTIAAVTSTQGADIVTSTSEDFAAGSSAANISTTYLGGMEDTAESQNQTFDTTAALLIILVLIGVLAITGFKLTV